MSHAPTRAQIIEVARALILREGSGFSLVSLCQKLNCSRSGLRRHFPNKAALITEVFAGARTEAPPVVQTPLWEMPVPESVPADKDWIQRRFRIFERAIASLEGQIEDLRQSSGKSFASIDRKWAELTAGAQENKPGVEADGLKGAEQEADESAPVFGEEAIGLSTGAPLQSLGVADLEPVSVELPPIVTAMTREIIAHEMMAHEIEEDTAPRPNIRDKAALFFTSAPEQGPDRKELREMAIFGAAVFMATLTVIVLVFAITNRAGASYLARDAARVHHEKPKNDPVAKVNAVERVMMGNCIAVNIAAPITPNSLAKTFSANDLRLEKPSADPAAEHQSMNCDPKEKLKFALAYLRGEGVKSDPMMGAFWSQASAQQGNADAQYVLGTLYAEGIKPDPERAYYWFSSAAVKGNPKAMHNLAIALLNGTGVAKDQSSAVNWFVRAANLGYRDSAFNLGVLYERGEGVQQNTRSALFWYDKASASGDSQAINRAKILRSDGLVALNEN